MCAWLDSNQLLVQKGNDYLALPGLPLCLNFPRASFASLRFLPFLLSVSRWACWSPCHVHTTTSSLHAPGTLWPGQGHPQPALTCSRY